MKIINVALYVTTTYYTIYKEVYIHYLVESEVCNYVLSLHFMVESGVCSLVEWRIEVCCYTSKESHQGQCSWDNVLNQKTHGKIKFS